MTQVNVNTERVLEVTPHEVKMEGTLYANAFIGAGYITPMELDELMEVYASDKIDKVEVYFGGLHVNSFRLHGCTKKEIRRSQPGAEQTNVTQITPVMGHVQLGEFIEVNRNIVTHRQPLINADNLVVTKCVHSERKAIYTLGGTRHMPTPFKTVLRVFIPQNRLHQQTK